MSGSWAREGLLGWSAGLQEHPGEIKEQFDAIVTREFGIFPFLVFFFFLLLLETTEVPSQKELVGVMPFGRERG